MRIMTGLAAVVRNSIQGAVDSSVPVTVPVTVTVTVTVTVIVTVTVTVTVAVIFRHTNDIIDANLFDRVSLVNGWLIRVIGQRRRAGGLQVRHMQPSVNFGYRLQ